MKKNKIPVSYYILAVFLAALLVSGLSDAAKAMETENMISKKVWNAATDARGLLEEVIRNRSADEEEKLSEPEPEPESEPEEVQTSSAAEPVLWNPLIRVLLKTNGFQEITHPEVVLSSAAGLILTCEGVSEEWPAAEGLRIAPDDARFEHGAVRVESKDGSITVESMKRGYGVPTYQGVLELRRTAEGIVLINELQLESYLCAVVPSEMPSSYELEALKAQAVCARSFAYRQMADYGYPEYEAHVDDSTSYQVYGNSEMSERAVQAVQETAGEVVRLDGELVTTYYYATSCGKTTSMAAWGGEENASNRYLRSVDVKDENGDYERELPWYRWTASIPVQTLSDLAELNVGTDVGNVQDIRVSQTGPGGIAMQLLIIGDQKTVTVETENKIRRALGGKGYTIVRQDGSEVNSTKLLPSAFFTIERAGDQYVIRGGGYGHGIGMSQTAAGKMAEAGKTYQEILTFFYPEVTVSK